MIIPFVCPFLSSKLHLNCLCFMLFVDVGSYEKWENFKEVFQLIQIIKFFFHFLPIRVVLWCIF